METVEKSVSTGTNLLIENMGEDVDAVLDPLLGRQLIKKVQICFTFHCYLEQYSSAGLHLKH